MIRRPLLLPMEILHVDVNLKINSLYTLYILKKQFLLIDANAVPCEVQGTKKYCVQIPAKAGTCCNNHRKCAKSFRQ
jgi:hypothetical protein